MDTTPERRPGNLPGGLPSFVGRDVELAEIDRALRLHRLVTVTGVAGVGKSRTALRAAERAAGRFPDGVWIVALSQLVDPAHVPQAVALALRVRDQTARPETDLLAEHLAGRRCLIVLDTCEHLVSGCAALARTITAASAGTRVLVTGRRRLDAPGEEVVELAPLPLPPETPDLDAMAGCPSVALFAERAREHVPDFAVTPAGAAAVTALCRRLGGLPLAIELAAAQLAHRTVEDLAEHPGIHPDGPVPRRTAPVLAPHGGLWTAIGWSHELCTPAERLLWARVTVFAGAFTLEAAEDVCTGGPLTDVEGALEGLVDKSVLLRRPNGRHRLPGALREYGASWLAELGEERDARRRHRDRYLEMARDAYPEWTGAGQADWYRWFASEFAEVRKALETSLAEPGPVALELAGALWFFWVSCDFERAGREFLGRALAQDGGPGPLRVRAAWALGSVLNFQGDAAGIERCVAECRAAAPDPTAVRAADYIEAADLALSGRPERALEPLLRLAAEPWDDPVQEATWMLARGILAFAHVVMGDYPAATALAADMRRDGESRGEHRFRGYGHYIHALVALFSGDHGAAAGHAADAFDSFKLLGDASNMALNLEVIAIADHLDGAPERAAVLLGVSTRLWGRDGGRARCTAPRLADARRACEKSVAAAIGEEQMATLFRTGLHSAWP